MAKPQVHVWDRDQMDGHTPVKTGDVVRIVDALNPDERQLVENLRKLGPYKIHDARAQVLERMAAGARANADVLKLYELYPFLEGDAPIIESTRWRALGLIVISLAFVGLLIAAFNNKGQGAPPTPPSSVEASQEAVSAPEVANQAPRAQKGRVGR